MEGLGDFLLSCPRWSWRHGLPWRGFQPAAGDVCVCVCVRACPALHPSDRVSGRKRFHVLHGLYGLQVCAVLSRLSSSEVRACPAIQTLCFRELGEGDTSSAWRNITCLPTAVHRDQRVLREVRDVNQALLLGGWLRHRGPHRHIDPAAVQAVVAQHQPAGVFPCDAWCVWGADSTAFREAPSAHPQSLFLPALPRLFVKVRVCLLMWVPCRLLLCVPVRPTMDGTGVVTRAGRRLHSKCPCTRRPTV
jgi:hypothetical protein